jgi:CubicO group peptidase (beta-lactamase class C family)
MKRRTRRVGLVSLLLLVAACGSPTVASTPGVTAAPSEATAAVIDDYRARVPALMKEQGIPGLAVAVVDDTGVVWAEGFGVTDGVGSDRVTPDTLFSIQSMSKAFTATGVMLAVQDGLLDLDEPITTYLPHFTVNSTFELRPESKITLRHLLGHTAGFTHEAPVGNNWDADADSFDGHIRSISDTWLRFPVGTGYAYSNLGIDLAGYILQQVTGRPFADWERDRLLQPLGMTGSSFDADVIRAVDERAVGHDEGRSGYVPVPMVPAGGMYASADDLARFLQFQLGHGSIDGKQVLEPALLDEMLTVQYPERSERYGYGLGVARTGWYRGRNADLFSHGGGGFGFLADLWWLPELQLGIAVLTNSATHDLHGSLALGILDDLVHAPGPYLDRLGELPTRDPVRETDGHWLAPPSLAADVRALALPPDPERWHGFEGQFKTADNGVIDPTTPPSRIYEQDGQLYFDGRDTDDATYQLFEVRRGLFLTETGEALDLRSDPPTFRNLELTRVGSGPQPLVRAVLALGGVVMLASLLAWPARRLRRARRPRPVEPPALPAGRATNLAIGSVATVTALCGLASLGLLVALPRIIYSGFIGWLDVPVWMKLWLYSPLGLLVCTVALAVLMGWGWKRGWWQPRQRRVQTALVAAALVQVTLLGVWGLIGVG